MAAPKGVEAFLEAEEQAWRLIDELRRLKGEVESYRTARSALQDAGDNMARLADELANVARSLGEVIQTLKAIGTPELLRAQQAAATEIRRAVDTSVIAQRAALNSTTNELLGAQEAATTELSALRTELAETRDSIHEAADELLRSQSMTSQQFRSLRRFSFMSVGVTLVGFLILVVVFVARL